MSEKQDELEKQAAPEVEGGTLPRRRGMKVMDDAGARCVVELLRGFAERVPHEPSIKPPPEGMVRLGGRDRASYVWFLPCHPDGKAPAPVSGGGLCNHGIGIDRQWGAYEVRGWAHGAPGVHDVSLHTSVVTLEHLETAARLVGIPFGPPCPQEIILSDPEGSAPVKECRA